MGGFYGKITASDVTRYDKSWRFDRMSAFLLIMSASPQRADSQDGGAEGPNLTPCRHSENSKTCRFSTTTPLRVARLQPVCVRRLREPRFGRAQRQTCFAQAVAEMIAVSEIPVWLEADYTLHGRVWIQL